MKQMIPRPGEKYRHFKGKLYQVIAVATHSETKEKMVVYQALYGDFGVYVRPYEMFVSEVDRDKYPAAAQQLRFQQLNADEEDTEEQRAPEEMVQETNFLLDFLETGSHSERIRILDQMKKNLSDANIQIMADSMDLVLRSDDMESKYFELRDCLVTLEKYEKRR